MKLSYANELNTVYCMNLTLTAGVKFYVHQVWKSLKKQSTQNLNLSLNIPI